MPRVWFITGASSGFGLTVAQSVLQKGETVVATCRSPPSAKDLQALQATYPEPKLVILPLDVTSRASVEAAFKATVDRFGRIDVVFNNAGYGVISEVELVEDSVDESEEKIRKMFETNFWGATWVAREAVRVFREVNLQRKKEGVADVESRMIVNSSAVTWANIATTGYYAATKHALEGLIETLANELNPDWNIKITIIQPGEFKTNAGTTSIVTIPAHPAYADPKLASHAIRQHFSNFVSNGDVNKAVDVIYKLSQLDAPPLRMTIGKDAIMYAKAQLKKLTEEVEKYENYSDDLVIL